ncbi:MAG: hypothetical protein M3O67_04390, partial [Bacteroidota bacterium]|nr:hypothetical protein [Bacteroidota bacterium]
AAYYGINKNDEEARQKATRILKKKTKVIKSDYGELKVKVWDKNRNKAADFANAIMKKLQLIHQDIQNANNVMMLEKLKQEHEKKVTEFLAIKDTTGTNGNNSSAQFFAIKGSTILVQIQEYEKLISQYELMVNAKPQVLIVVEKGKPPVCFDRPKRAQLIIATAVLSFIFALLTVLVLERRKFLHR